jgi:hypothetical protein
MKDHTRVRVVLHAPALSWINPQTHINLRDEVTRVSDREQAILASVFDAEFDHQLANLQETDTRQVA